jgi:hypothetical protein
MYANNGEMVDDDGSTFRRAEEQINMYCELVYWYVVIVYEYVMYNNRLRSK